VAAIAFIIASPCASAAETLRAKATPWLDSLAHRGPDGEASGSEPAAESRWASAPRQSSIFRPPDAIRWCPAERALFVTYNGEIFNTGSCSPSWSRSGAGSSRFRHRVMLEGSSLGGIESDDQTSHRHFRDRTVTSGA